MQLKCHLSLSACLLSIVTSSHLQSESVNCCPWLSQQNPFPAGKAALLKPKQLATLGKAEPGKMSQFISSALHFPFNKVKSFSVALFFTFGLALVLEVTFSMTVCLTLLRKEFLAHEVKYCGVSRVVLTSIPLGNFTVLFRFAVKNKYECQAFLWNRDFRLQPALLSNKAICFALVMEGSRQCCRAGCCSALQHSSWSQWHMVSFSLLLV